MFIPITKKEIEKLGWHQLDIIFITGDAYIDSANIGVALLGKYLIKKGYKVALIPQPDISNESDIKRFGEPRLFWGVTGGSVDSMVANYTASKKFRKQDDYTPGEVNNKRPDRAVIKYTNLIRQYYKNTSPIVLGGIEASLRRVTHYDFWSDKLRKPIIFDAKADYLIYGMAERAIFQLAKALENGDDPASIKGLCYISKSGNKEYIDLPSWSSVNESKKYFVEMYRQFYQNCDPVNASGLTQKIDTRYWVQNPPSEYLTEQELSEIYDIEFERAAHPSYHGKIRALDTIQFSVPTHRGCYGECNFCAIAVHEGTRVRWRNETSIAKEVKSMTSHRNWKGNVSDLCGPTANMYGYECAHKIRHGKCKNKRCMSPALCNNIQPDHSRQIRLLEKISAIPGVKKVFVSSGIRPELIRRDKKFGEKYFKRLVKHHVSGQLKLAPESTDERILHLMGKPGFENFVWFRKKFEKYTKDIRKNQFLTYYFIAAHPGCDDADMKKISHQVFRQLNIRPEQVQIFTPTPSTWSSVMYYTETDPFTGGKIYVEKNSRAKVRQKSYLQKKNTNRKTKRFNSKK
ncbi:MAG: YgiQ family radical SAM protein [Fidelibacterota bacterium]